MIRNGSRLLINLNPELMKGESKKMVHPLSGYAASLSGVMKYLPIEWHPRMFILVNGLNCSNFNGLRWDRVVEVSISKLQ